MARANSKSVSKFNTAASTNVVTNLAGGKGYKYPPELELAIRCASNFMEDSFYAKNNDIKKSIRNLVMEIGEKDPTYVMKLAGWLRNEMNMRSISIYLLALMAGHPSYQRKPKPWINTYGPYIMIRADEPAEALAAFQSAYPGEKIPQALQKAINARLNKFSAYDAIKYRGEKRDWSLKDVIRVTHPKPANRSIDYLFNWIVNGEATEEGAKEVYLDQLASYLSISKANSFNEINIEALDGVTWEILVSKFGSKPEVWQAAAKVMPSMAYIRNLRNLLDKSGNMEIDAQKITMAGKGKRILPFRFLTAKKVVDGLGHEFSKEAKKVKKALEDAIELSVSNVPNLGNVAILVDYSGSMSHKVSSKSDMTCSDAARIFAAAAFKRADNAVIIEYDSYANVVTGIEKDDRLFSIVDNMQTPNGGTNLSAAVQLAGEYIKHIDMVYILTDEQSWQGSSWGHQGDDAMGKLLGMKPSLKVVNHNLMSYGTSDLPQDSRILDIGGWSDQIFNVVDAWGKGDMVGTIRNWHPDVREDD